MGLECAKAFLDSGTKVVLIDRTADRLQTICDGPGAESIPVVVDLLDLASVACVTNRIPKILEKAGGLGLFQANVDDDIVDDNTDGDIMLNLNIKSAFRTIHALLPHMIEQKSCDIIVTSSSAGFVPGYTVLISAMVSMSAMGTFYTPAKGDLKVWPKHRYKNFELLQSVGRQLR